MRVGVSRKALSRRTGARAAGLDDRFYRQPQFALRCVVHHGSDGVERSGGSTFGRLAIVMDKIQWDPGLKNGMGVALCGRRVLAWSTCHVAFIAKKNLGI